jgi:hypothetical protein
MELHEADSALSISCMSLAAVCLAFTGEGDEF